MILDSGQVCGVRPYKDGMQGVSRHRVPIYIARCGDDLSFVAIRVPILLPCTLATGGKTMMERVCFLCATQVNRRKADASLNTRTSDMRAESSQVEFVSTRGLAPHRLTIENASFLGPRSWPLNAAIVRLVGALLLEQNDEWQLQRRYFSLGGLGATSDNQSQRLSAVMTGLLTRDARANSTRVSKLVPAEIATRHEDLPGALCRLRSKDAGGRCNREPAQFFSDPLRADSIRCKRR
jgi:hypothetical protein